MVDNVSKNLSLMKSFSVKDKENLLLLLKANAVIFELCKVFNTQKHTKKKIYTFNIS